MGKNNSSSKGKIVLALILFAVLIFLIMQKGEKESEESLPEIDLQENQTVSIEELANYPFGQAIIDGLKEIGAESDVKEFTSELTNWNTYSFKADAGKCRLWIMAEQSLTSDDWELEWIKDYDTNNYYYLNERDKFTYSGLLTQNIYSYQTGEIAEEADEQALQQYREQLDADMQARKEEREQQRREEATALFCEIREAYRNNELSADDTYKGNRYTLIGQFDGAKDDGLFNDVLDEVNVTVKVMDGNTPCYLICSFDSDTWREELVKYNKGDEIIFEGECVSWGVWNDCELTD